jgi:hypothetical protein
MVDLPHLWWIYPLKMVIFQFASDHDFYLALTDVGDFSAFIVPEVPLTAVMQSKGFNALDGFSWRSSSKQPWYSIGINGNNQWIGLR